MTTATYQSPPLLLDARALADVLGLSRAYLLQMNRSGKIPAPIKLGRKAVRWRAGEISRWVAAGCPDRRTWEESERLRRQRDEDE